jgi:hypothetical protein
VNSHVKFIRRQANEVAHRLAREATSLANFHIFINSFGRLPLKIEQKKPVNYI